MGVGLIGGSFARAIRKSGFQGRIVGVSSEAVAREARELGVIDEAQPLEAACRGADLIYLAQPIQRILKTIPQLDAWISPDALVTDAGSTKRQIVEKARKTFHRAQFLGGHPMAGKETRGVGAADANLFRGRTYLLTPGSEDELSTGKAQEFLSMLKAAGARIKVMSPDDHDRVVAYTSHLPQLLSTALAATVREALDPADLDAAGPGLLDSTRLALSSFEMWADILDTNREEIDGALERCIKTITDVRRKVQEGSLESGFRAAAAFSQALRERLQ